jgi:hypothetical protein
MSVISRLAVKLLGGYPANDHSRWILINLSITSAISGLYMRGQLVFHFLALSLHSYTTAKYMYVKDPNDRSIEQNTYWGGTLFFLPTKTKSSTVT